MMTRKEIEDALANGRYLSVGGYPLFFYTEGDAYSFAAVAEAVADDHAWLLNKLRGVKVNWEDPELYCDVSGNRIESAYAEGLAAVVVLADMDETEDSPHPVMVSVQGPMAGAWAKREQSVLGCNIEMADDEHAYAIVENEGNITLLFEALGYDVEDSEYTPC